jgi:serine/threonine protein phosphatase PrpC
VSKVLEKTNAYLLHYKAEEAQFSGSTALIAILTAASIYVFNVGNSRAVLAKHYQETNSIESFQVTHDHNLERFD